jgi:hypothetical protein
LFGGVSNQKSLEFVSYNSNTGVIMNSGHQHNFDSMGMNSSPYSPLLNKQTNFGTFKLENQINTRRSYQKTIQDLIDIDSCSEHSL